VTGLPATALTDEVSGETYQGPSFEVPARTALVLVP